MKLFKITQIVGLLSVALAIVAEDANADTFRYREGGAWQDISDGTTPGWRLNDGTVVADVPGLGDEARINWAVQTVTLDYEAPEINRLLIGVDEGGVLEVNSGGKLTLIEDLVVGNNGFVDATMDVNNGAVVDVGRILWLARGPNIGDTLAFFNINEGGVVNVASHLWWGSTGEAVVEISGTLNQTGGILGLGSQDFSVFGGTATVNVRSGGEFNLNNIHGGGTQLSIQSGSKIDIFGSGQVTIKGDQVGSVNGYVDAGLITGEGVQGNIDVSLTSGSVSGDFNEDGVVDAADYTVYRDNVGGLNGLPNDDGLGVVGQLHYDLWETNYGAEGEQLTVVTVAPAAALAVPEPGSLAIVGGMLVVGSLRARRHSVANRV
ncbi:hypothetical protein MalM25_22070 [Planctomycetes bacterium MalM25]|nr:hypothetical protein MalM25_22070 [Planctomycetes bacterium MalM25]